MDTTSDFLFPVPQQQEMCKRETRLPFKHIHHFINYTQAQAIIDHQWNQTVISRQLMIERLPDLRAVSYTHLTLPTICSV